ncbi:MAG: hypothetical protein QMD82_08065 [bacterium]|nr:hypothetical protein [bacterium]
MLINLISEFPEPNSKKEEASKEAPADTNRHSNKEDSTPTVPPLLIKVLDSPVGIPTAK